ncbi:MAG: ABC transporter ATP-binding protein/permease [Burkholderiaceae bacterium]|nr:ABC transporter ATP-binding protein/permease [Burkholderiaceae bacterium]
MRGTQNRPSGGMLPIKRAANRSDWQVINDLLPYLFEHRFRVLFAMLCLVAAKFANLGVPIVLKDLIDAMNIKPGSLQSYLIVPAGLIGGYGALRLLASLFSELRELLFAKVTQSAVRKIALQVFEHLHALSLQFHLGRQTGGVSRDIERGTRGIQTLVSFSLYSILPTIIEFVLVLAYFAYNYDIWFAIITFVALVVYIFYTIKVMMIQLYIPLNFLGVIYREMKQSITDMDHMFTLLNEDQEIKDSKDAKPLLIRDFAKGPEVRFEHVYFSYNDKREILKDLSFTIPAGTITAVVGQSGAGKSTLARLLFRFYDVQSGAILLDGQNIQEVEQASLRKVIGIVPQDTVLFNDSIAYNIAYGNPQASHEAIVEAARAAQMSQFIEHLPQGYETPVGERGLKLSGGEKQRVAIARTLLKKPALLIFDEATSALDSKTERAFQDELFNLAKNRTTLIIAHRLSTVVHADQILVMEHGQIIERGTHYQLLEANGRYASMWQLQENSPIDPDQAIDN